MSNRSPHGCADVDRLEKGGRRLHPGLRKQEQFMHHCRHFLNLIAQDGDVFAVGSAGSLLQDAEGKLNACDRCTKFVSDVAQESLLMFDESFQTAGHAIDLLAQMTQLIAAVTLDIDAKSPMRDLLG